MEKPLEILDYSHQKLKKLNKPSPKELEVVELILDDNELQRLDNIDSYIKLQKLSACRNQLLRMYGVCRLHNLHTLNLAYNGILMIEGLKDLTGLKWLCLAGNSIKTIEHLNTNICMEYLDLSENSITHISDLSFLKNLKELFLNKNKINHLGQCDRFLPASLTTLTLANNNISDLNEISRLSHLVNLTKISICNNPCVNMTGGNIGFDYRPFVINWCLNVNVIDDYVVDAIESLRAEWLYSQGRGRHFRIGDQKELTQYLAAVCPLTGETLETEEDRKLRLILSKAQHHQQQLREQSSNNTPQPSPATKKKLQQNKNSPRINTLRQNKRNKSPDRMVTSYYGSVGGDNYSQSIMSQSLDPTLLRQSIMSQGMSKSMQESVNNYCNTPDKYSEIEAVNSPLQALSKMVPVPENLMSPDYKPPSLIGKTISTQHSMPMNRVSSGKDLPVVRSPKSVRASSAATTRNQTNNDFSRKVGGSPSPCRQKKIANLNSNKQEVSKKSSILRRKSPSSEDESEICDSKLHMIQMKVQERKQQRDSEILNSSSNEEKVERAAICIQKVWRGYYTRNKDKEVQEMFRTLQNQRASQYIQKLASDMETTKAALESERKIQMLQTEAISALWKKISSLQMGSSEANPPGNINMTNLSETNAEVIKGLAQTCSLLQNQIQQLQVSMQDIVKVMTVFSHSAGMSGHLKENGIATQTEIVAVHTPQGENGKNFPFQKSQSPQLQQSRPSSLPLPVNQRRKDNLQSGGVNQELKQFAGSLIEDVIKTVSETKSDGFENGDNSIGIRVNEDVGSNQGFEEGINTT
ncbi:centrosomal protein of 97 kDa-like [Cylas formicarius]|uniref:centrosomal protein of 97 kDa-like n=1 Tax=Cylas formicarius TaxID=197179 RepID=UPI0029583A4D|nr:centrosomal protein of 97 kDa-like [Cylas formicarius]